MKILLLTLTLLTVACNDQNKIVTAPATTSNNNELTPGDYQMTCFHNKLASQGIGMDVYTTATLHLEEGQTGTNTFSLFDDASCTNLLMTGTTAILHYESRLIDGINVFVMEQDDGSQTMELWIPYTKVAEEFYMDVNFSNGQSGPYVSEPSPAELDGFKMNPNLDGTLLITL